MNITAVTFILFRPTQDILMQLRDGNSKHYAYTWCFPGGKIEPGESEMEALVREVKEEYELDVTPADCKELMISSTSYGTHVKIFVCRIAHTQSPVLHEGADMKWMQLEEIKSLDLGFEQEKIIPKLEEFLFTKSTSEAEYTTR